MSDADKIRIKLDAIRILLREIEAMIESGRESGETREVESLAPPPVYVIGNPYADTSEKVRIETDINLYLEESATAPYLQSRYCRALWDIAEAMNVQLEIANACLLSGVPANNTAHYDDCRTVDSRYLSSDAQNKDLIIHLLASFPVYDKAAQYNKWASDDSEVRVSPEIRDRLKLPWVNRIQADPAGNHDNHLHVRFGV